jgi:hypothetical protein
MKQKLTFPPGYWEEYERRVEALEAQGLTRSDAQGCVDCEDGDIRATVQA